MSFAPARAWKETEPGRKVAGYLPIYVPLEIIRAAGMLPLGVLGGGDGLEVIRGDAYYQSYIFRIPRSSTCAGARPSPVALKNPSKPVNFQSAWVRISAAPLASIFLSRALIIARPLPLAWALGSTPIVSRTAILPELPNSPS